jgi:hypothetical protein
VIGPTGAVRVMVATRPVDFRKGADGLAALVRESMAADPFSGAVYVQRDICGTALPGKCFRQTFHPGGTVRSYVRPFSAVIDRWP